VVVVVGACLVVVVEPVFVFPLVAPGCAAALLEAVTGVPSGAIRHPSEVLTSSTGRSDAAWPLAPDSVMAEALDPRTFTGPTASVG